MLFLLKRTWQGGLAGLILLTALGLMLRPLVPDPLPLELSLADVGWGLVTVGLVLLSDGLIHGSLLLVFGDTHRRKHRELAALFLHQTWPAILLGALMAGIGEELCFRGLDPGPAYLLGSALVFGLLHHVNRSLSLFTVWSIWQGVLFALGLFYFQRLGVTMTAHFLHDLTGFLLFRFVFNRRGPDGVNSQTASPSPPGPPTRW
jgi:membrane protease YdiL (CAAX protease family)